MARPFGRPIERQVDAGWNAITKDRPAVVAMDADGLSVRPRGRRKPTVWLSWSAVVGAASAMAMNGKARVTA